MSLQQQRPAILVVDIGSSSVRCSVYDARTLVVLAQTSIQVRLIDKATGRLVLEEPAPSISSGSSFASGHSKWSRDASMPASSSDAPKSPRPAQADDDDEEELDWPRYVLDVVDLAVDRTLKQFQQRQAVDRWPILAIGMASCVMNLVAMTQTSEWLGSEATCSYACHHPSVMAQVEQLHRELGPDKIKELTQKTGAPLHTAYALPQLRALYQEETDPTSKKSNHYHESIYKWQTLSGACLARWTMQPHLPISLSEASWTGLLNWQTGQYEPDLLDLLPEACRQALPEVVDFDQLMPPDQPHGSVATDAESPGSPPPAHKWLRISKDSLYWNRWPLLRSARLFLGLGDGACANVGSKCTTAQRIAVTVGTSAAARICLPYPLMSTSPNTPSLSSSASAVAPRLACEIPRGLFCYRIDRYHVLVGGALTDGGSAVEWATQLLNLNSGEALRDCIVRTAELADRDYNPPPAKENQDDGHHPTTPRPMLTMVPFLSGERSTGYRIGATGAFLGLTRATTSAHLFKACLEGVTLRLHAIVQLILQLVRPSTPGEALSLDEDPLNILPTMVASGKALEVNGLWRQMLADCTGLDVVLDKDTKEGTSRGVARMILLTMSGQLEGKGPEESLDTTTAISMPRESARPYWDRAVAAQEELIEAVAPLYCKS